MLATLGHREWLRVAAGVGLLCSAGWYYRVHSISVESKVTLLQSDPSLFRDFWIGWASFFDRVSADGVASAKPFRLPIAKVDPVWTSRDVFVVCSPGGRPGIRWIPAEETHGADCRTFWDKLREVRKMPSPFDKVRLPASMAIVAKDQTPPSSDFLVCEVGAGSGPATPILLPW